ncbi:hypothetical protein vseg_013617 [Gypsophila vaccaria]
MNLDQRLLHQLTTAATATAVAATTTTIPLTTLASLRSLLTHPATTTVVTTTVLETLTRALSLSLHRHTLLHLLSLLRHHHHHHDHHIHHLLSSTSPRLAAAALSLLLSLPSFDFSSVDDDVLVSICFGPCVAVRVWFIRNSLRFGIRCSLLVTVLLGFTNDPYPNVREAALVALARVCESGVVVVDDADVVEACYFRAVELILDQDDDVRKAAVRAVGEWGRMLASLKQEELQKDWSDAVFLQLCSTVRDMNVGVRVAAFSALGKFALVSEDILLQALSKRILAIVKEKQSLALCHARQHKIHAAAASGAFVHGLEDEFNEVQQAACITLRMLPVVSGQFAGEAVNIVSYVLNDDSIIVRLEALRTVQHLVMSGHLKIQEEHIDMLLGTLVDSCPQIRSTATNIIGSVKLPTLKLSKMTVESLLESLDIYPKSEANVFRALFGMGQNNGHHSVSIIQDFYHEVEPCDDEKFGRNNHRVAGLIVLAISTSLKHDNYRRRIPQKVFTYAAAFFGRISHVFADIMDADCLLQYLSHCGSCSDSQPESAAQPILHLLAKDQTPTLHIVDVVNLNLAAVKSLWGLVKSGCTSEVLRTLRCCKGSLRTLRTDSIECSGLVAFAVMYIHVVKLICKIWHHFVGFRKSDLYQAGEPTIQLAKLEKLLLALRYRFSGLGVENELYILELLLLGYVLTLSSFNVNCKVLPKLRTIIAHMNHLRTATSVVSSDFVNQLFDLSSKQSLSNDRNLCVPSDLKKLRDLFIPKNITLTQRIRQVSAELVVTGFDSVTPVQFIPGLPVGVPLEITLYNVTSDHVLWLKLTLVDEHTEFVFLDLEEFSDVHEVMQVKFTSPFYRTPRAVAFTLRISIGIECESENLHPMKGYGGPQHVLTYINPEIEIYFVSNREYQSSL